MPSERLTNAEGRALLARTAKRHGGRQRDEKELLPAALVLDAKVTGRYTATRMIPEYRFHEARGWQFDWAFPARRLAVEVDGGTAMVLTRKDGRQYAGGGHNTDKDRVKMNEAAALGWRVMHFSPQQLRRDPLGCADVVRRALEAK